MPRNPPNHVILAIPPRPAMLIQAARCHGLWDELQIAGGKLIHQLAERWLATGKACRVLLLLGDVTEPVELNHRLRKLDSLGVQIEWFAPPDSPSARKACAGLTHVRLLTGANIQDAFEKLYPGRSVDGDLTNPELADYLRYKITLCFMRGMQPTPLVEAVQALVANGTRPFTLAAAVPADRPSVEHCRLADFPYVEGRSAPLMALKRRVVSVAATDLNTLILGQPGTGKEFVAFYLHEFSPRRAGPSVTINCAGFDEQFLRSELFGSDQGAITGAAQRREGLVYHARGGTLFMDEVGELPLPIQADLLRFLQTRRYRPLGAENDEVADVRVIVGAHPDLREKVKKSEFREDLYFRLAEVQIETPPLATLPEDIFRLARHVCFKAGEKLGRQAVDDAIAYFHRGERTLRRYDWPGNVRELISLVRRRLTLGDDVLAELNEKLKSASASPFLAVPIPETHTAIRPLEEIVTAYLQQAWSARGPLTQQQLAARLGISVNTLKSHLQQI